MTHRRLDIDDLDESLFTAEEAKRRRNERAEMVENHRQMDEAQRAIDAQLAAEREERGRQATARFMKREYEARGLQPPSVDGDGRPTVSLSLLLSIGWRIEQQADGRTVLVCPPTAERFVAKGESR